MNASTSASRPSPRSTSRKARETSAASSGTSATALADEIIAAVPASSRQRCWLDALPKDVRRSIEITRERLHAKQYDKSALGLAKSIRQKLTEMGLPCISVGGIREWLAKTP